MKKTSLFCGLLLASGLALAQQPGFYVGASVGQASVDSDANSLAPQLTSIGATNVAVTQDDSDTAWKIYGGYQLNPYFGIEGGYADLGKYTASATGNIGANGFTANGDVDAYAIFADLVGHLPLMDNSLSIFGKAGMAYTKTKLNASAAAAGFSASASDSDSEVVPKLGIGARYNFTKQFAVRAEYEWYFNVGDDNKTGESDIGMWSIGATVSF